MNERVYEAILKSEDRSRRYRERRLRQMRIRFLLTIAAIFLTLIMAISYRAILSDAKDSENITYKYYTSIEIQYGDTLWSIAQAYCSEEYDSVDDYIHEVMKINHLQPESVIAAGNHLIVPYFSEELK